MKKNIFKKWILMLICFFIFSQAFIGKTLEIKKHFKIGISEWTGYPDNVKGFKDQVQQDGIIENKNVTYLNEKSGMNILKQKKIAQKFKFEKVDLVYSLTTPGTLIMKKIIPSTTPIVFSIITYPADIGLIESLEYSGNNLVGTSNYVKLSVYIKLLMSILPKTKTVAIFHRKKEPNSKIQAANLIRLFKAKNISVIDCEPATIEQVRDMAFDCVGKVDVFITTTDTLMQHGGEDQLIKISLNKKIPILSSNKNGIIKGSTFGPVADFYQLGKMAGKMASKILKENIKPTSLESKIQKSPLFLFNKTSIKSLGIIVPDNISHNIKYVN